MPAELASALTHAVMITVFVTVMMISVEYLNVLTRGTFESALRGAPALQYLAAAVLGAIPGCLGAFTVVALYTHRVVTVGAVVACMIATSGDEAFVMLALFPRAALWLTLGLAVLGFLSAPVVDRLAGAARYAPETCARLTVHAEECRCFGIEAFLAQWHRPRRARILMNLALGGYVAWVVTGGGGLPPEWNWIRTTLLLVGAFGLFVVATVPDHFLDEHLWRHVAVQHVPRIFAWTAGVLIGVAVLEHFADVHTLVRENPWAMLLLASLIGIIPESGPHLVFVSLYAAGTIPISILVASSIVQDGHGMLPLLAQSRRDFVRIKAANLAVGLVVGAVMLALGL
jgi:hypothetical protein